MRRGMEASQIVSDLKRLCKIEASWEESAKETETNSSTATDGKPEELALKFAPALEHLEKARLGLEQVLHAALGAKARITWELKEWHRLGLVSHGEESLFPQPSKQPSHEDVSFDFEWIQERLSQANTADDFCTIVNDFLGSEQVAQDVGEQQTEQSIKVPMWWLHRKQESKSHSGKDTTHQDARDIERDILVLDGVKLDGAQYKYEGIVMCVQRQLEQKLRWLQGEENDGQVEEVISSTLKRFARAIICAGNRTHSGGNAYEAVMVMFGASEKVLVTPDSNRAEPIQVRLSLEPFQLLDEDGQLHSVYGVVARVSAKTKFLLKDPNDVENSILGVAANFEQTLGLSIPLKRYACKWAQDDRKSADNINQYKVFENPRAFVDGVVSLSTWDWTEPQIGEALHLM